ncbi:Gfo/Idh/MocA family oxidoreductase [Salegentibacter sp. F188]|uniref:Gfo/Idh/MocA family oxidoreductase n=1 Tax=Autumnicola patrickiae TaxID=3075591 RepID=A0ABU3E1L1_9FLAO|nr:Gfo/Idh/MocA family oxidoreductase [Salegentibacter sp. F188]MDT0689579.1 Gfo/Idh/MocA family oxidoreductase [Salegentibacter sp. F188]
MNSKIKLGILGGGGDSLIGVLHRIASSMFDQFELVGGVFNPELKESIAFAEGIGLSTNRIYEDLDSLIEKEKSLPENERMQVISVLTPNFLHFPMAKQLLENDFHVICEKPLTTTYEEAKTLENLRKKSQKVFAVTYTYTGYPMVRQMKEMIAAGEIGEIHKVDVQYYQGWINEIIHDKEKRSSVWRLDPEKAGISSCIGDIGTHAFNMIEYLTDMRVSEILSDLNYLYEDNKMDIDGTVLVRFSDYAKGIIRSSQVATGEENNLTVKIYGEKGGFKWEQENPNYLYFMKEGQPVELLKPGHPYNSKISLDGTKLPPGHPEGIFDSMGNIYKGVARAVRNENFHTGEYPDLREGVRGVNFIEKTIESHKNGNVWVKLDN